MTMLPFIGNLLGGWGMSHATTSEHTSYGSKSSVHQPQDGYDLLMAGTAALVFGLAKLGWRALDSFATVGQNYGDTLNLQADIWARKAMDGAEKLTGKADIWAGKIVDHFAPKLPAPAGAQHITFPQAGVRNADGQEYLDLRSYSQIAAESQIFVHPAQPAAVQFTNDPAHPIIGIQARDWDHFPDALKDLPGMQARSPDEEQAAASYRQGLAAEAHRMAMAHTAERDTTRSR